jgi:1,4-alpha-glucan branching enzyme
MEVSAPRSTAPNPGTQDAQAASRPGVANAAHRLHDVRGAHLETRDGTDGVRFAVWAPNARSVGVMGDFNGWSGSADPLSPSPSEHGVWQGFVPHAHPGQRYKYRVQGPRGDSFDKADPFAFQAEEPPLTASRVWASSHRWNDGDWMRSRARHNALDAPVSIYEVHLGSWQGTGTQSEVPFLNYQDLGQRLADYALSMGFTHVELMPLGEHPFYGSWGYQTTGYFAPSARYGSPDDLKQLVDTLHQNGIGVILDWVPSHFPSDAHGLGNFDGTALYEHPDPRIGFHPQWNSLIFDYARPEVRDFLTSNALFWLEHFHFDGLRVDAVASMLYLDFARKPGEWVPNESGGNQNRGAVRFLQELNTTVYQAFPDVQVFAEESSSWEGVSRPVYAGGLGFGLKWNMGWMNDTLRHLSRPHFYREYHRDEVRFSLCYAFNENFLLPLSHDEVVHGKGSLISRQPGDEWQRFAGLRALYGYMWAHPGKKLLFMGGEFAQLREWHHDTPLDWHLLANPLHAGVQRWVGDLNRYYRRTPALFEDDFSPQGFAWAGELAPTVLAFFRRGRDDPRQVLAVCNLTPQPLPAVHLGVPFGGVWTEVLNSDSQHYGGSGSGNLGGCMAQAAPHDGHPFRISVSVPPLGVVFMEGAPS